MNAKVGKYIFGRENMVLKLAHLQSRLTPFNFPVIKL